MDGHGRTRLHVFECEIIIAIAMVWILLETSALNVLVCSIMSFTLGLLCGLEVAWEDGHCN